MLPSNLPARGRDDDPDDDVTVGWFRRYLPYAVGLGLAMAILGFGAFPQFRSYLAQRRGANAAGTVAAALGDAATGGSSTRSERVLAAVDFRRHPDVSVAVQSDDVVLTGVVGSLAERFSVEADVRRAAPGASILNQLVVDEDTPSRSGAGSTLTTLTTLTTLATLAPPAAKLTTSTTVPAIATTVTSAALAVTTVPPTTVPPTTVPVTAPPTTTAPPASAPAAPAVSPLVTLQAEIKALLTAEPIQFDTSDPQPRGASAGTLDRLAVLLARFGGSVEVSGNTDDVGIPTANLDLSQDRAGRVRLELIARGIAADRLTAVGYGDTRPEVPNDSDANRQRNRRIELSVRT